MCVRLPGTPPAPHPPPPILPGAPTPTPLRARWPVWGVDSQGPRHPAPPILQGTPNPPCVPAGLAERCARCSPSCTLQGHPEALGCTPGPRGCTPAPAQAPRCKQCPWGSAGAKPREPPIASVTKQRPKQKPVADKRPAVGQPRGLISCPSHPCPVTWPHSFPRAPWALPTALGGGEASRPHPDLGRSFKAFPGTCHPRLSPQAI